MTSIYTNTATAYNILSGDPNHKNRESLEAYNILSGDHNHKDRESLERIISQSTYDSYKYAQFVIKGRWELGEAAISDNPLYSYWYARNLIKGRFKLGEAVISTSAEMSYEYAEHVIKGRFELGEAVISESYFYSYWYARYVIKGRFVLGEAAISKKQDALTCLAEIYAKEVIRGNWTPELAVMCPCWLYTYAKDVIKGRLPSTMHNKMLSFGMIDSSDKYVKKYLGAKKYCTLKGIRVTKQKRLKCKIQDRC